jgi:negative regulator of sigma E activity
MARHDRSFSELLSRQLDGELSVEEEKRAKQLLASDAALAREHKSLQVFGELLRQDHKRKISQVDFSRLANSIVEEAFASPPRTFWEKVEDFFQERFGRAAAFWLPATAMAAAALAAFLLYKPKIFSDGPSNELIITHVDTDKTWISQTIDNEGTTILWIDDSEE